jgi:hypothetical protein
MAIVAGLGLVAGVAGSFMGKGSKVKVPDFVPVNATDEQGKALSGNLMNFSQANQLSDLVNTANQDSLMTAMRRAIPNYDKIISAQSSDILSGLNGELSQGEIDQAQSASAASSLARFGSTRSGMARNLGLRDLGLTRRALVDRSLSNASNFVGVQRSTAVPSLMGPEFSMLSPAARIANAQWNSTGSYNRNLAAAGAAAQPDPTAAAAGNMLSGLGGMAFSYAGGFGAFGGSGGSGSGSGSGGSWYGGDLIHPNVSPASNPYFGGR